MMIHVWLNDSFKVLKDTETRVDAIMHLQKIRCGTFHVI